MKITHFNLIEVLQQIEQEKNIPKASILLALEQALVFAYKKKLGIKVNLSVNIDPQTGKIKAFKERVVALEPQDENQISVAEAEKLGYKAVEGDKVLEEVKISGDEMGRISALTARQVLQQKILDAERNIIFNEFKEKESNLVTGVVQRVEGRNIYFDLGKLEGLLPSAEQVYGEKYRFQDRYKLYVIEVKKSSKGPLAIVSRTHPGLVRKLFELEVPEIQDGVVEIQGVVRDPGRRTKIAVSSKNENIEPVGTCIGQRGARVNPIVEELRGEKIDIIRYNEDTKKFIEMALAPAKIQKIEINEESRSAKVFVTEDQMSLSIGKAGQNIKLAARLCGYRLDVEKIIINEEKK